MLNEGFQSAFLACVVLAGIGMALALLLPGRPRKAPQEPLEPAPATSRGSETERGNAFATTPPQR